MKTNYNPEMMRKMVEMSRYRQINRCFAMFWFLVGVMVLVVGFAFLVGFAVKVMNG